VTSSSGSINTASYGQGRSTPRCVVVAVMRNEADMLESFVRYHAQFAAGILLIDHRSTDASRAIATALEREGLPLVLRGYDDLEFDQARFINAHADEAARHFAADWVLPFDLDELLAADDGGPPTAELAAMDGTRPVQLPWRTYVPTLADPTAEPCPPRRIRHRLVRETVPFHKIAVPSALLAGGRCRIAVGNHDLLDGRTRRPVPAAVALCAPTSHISRSAIRTSSPPRSWSAGCPPWPRATGCRPRPTTGRPASTGSSRAAPRPMPIWRHSPVITGPVSGVSSRRRSSPWTR
jgi:hypothetical protein